MCLNHCSKRACSSQHQRSGLSLHLLVSTCACRSPAFHPCPLHSLPPSLAPSIEASKITAATDAAVSEYTAARQRLAEQLAVVRAVTQQPQHSLHFLRPGRIVRVTEGEFRECLAWLMRFTALLAVLTSV